MWKKYLATQFCSWLFLPVLLVFSSSPLSFKACLGLWLYSFRVFFVSQCILYWGEGHLRQGWHLYSIWWWAFGVPSKEDLCSACCYWDDSLIRLEYNRVNKIGIIILFMPCNLPCLYRGRVCFKYVGIGVGSFLHGPREVIILNWDWFDVWFIYLITVKCFCSFRM